MRTTIDLPEDLLRRAKAAAALKGMKLKEFVAATLERGMRMSGDPVAPGQQVRRELPEMIPAAGRKIPMLTNAQIFEFLDQEDDKQSGRLP